MTAEDRFAMLCDAYGVTMWRVRQSNRCMTMCQLRRTIALSMRAAGHSFPEIGRAMDRDHSTIINMIRPRSKQRRLANVVA